MKTRFSILSLLMLCPLATSWSQLLPPNEAGVTMGHVHLTVRDVEANKKLFTLIGGTPVKVGKTDAMKFPGIFVFLTQGAPSLNNEGSVVNHFGFGVPNVRNAMAKWKAEGIKTSELTKTRGAGQDMFFVITPDDQRIEINEDKTAQPISSYHIHFWALESSLPEMRAWYSKLFDPAAGPRGANLAIPGMRLSMRESPAPTLPTRGRVVDHIGFEIKNLERFCQKLEASGVKLDEPYSKTRQNGFASAELIDPWGTSIELTEGLDGF